MKTWAFVRAQRALNVAFVVRSARGAAIVIHRDSVPGRIPTTTKWAAFNREFCYIWIGGAR